MPALSSSRRNMALAAALLALLAAGAAVLPSASWTLGLSALLALAAVVLLRGDRWRTGALLVFALAMGALGANLLAGWFTPQAMGEGVVRTTEPQDALVPDPVLGYHVHPGVKIKAHETFAGKLVYDATYTVLADSTRITPAAPPNADTYIFMGDSFMFGEGLPDSDTVPAQFARETGFKVRTVNFSASGYGTNHLVRALEAGVLDKYRGQPVKAVVTWIIPDHLRRITGDGEWLGSSPRYVLENGIPRYTGSFTEHRLYNPLDGLAYVARQHLAFIKAIGERERQEAQGDLFVALMLRMQALVRERFGAPLLVVYSWTDDASWPDENASPSTHSPLVQILDRLRQARLPLLFVDHETKGYDASAIQIPNDGHPNAFANKLLAMELRRRLFETVIQ